MKETCLGLTRETCSRVDSSVSNSTPRFRLCLLNLTRPHDFDSSTSTLSDRLHGSWHNSSTFNVQPTSVWRSGNGVRRARFMGRVNVFVRANQLGMNQPTRTTQPPILKGTRNETDQSTLMLCGSTAGQ